MNRFIRRLASAMLLGVAVYLSFSLHTGLQKISASLRIFHWSAFAIALSLATTNYGIRFLKWQYLARRDCPTWNAGPSVCVRSSQAA